MNLLSLQTFFLVFTKWHLFSVMFDTQRWKLNWLSLFLASYTFQCWGEIFQAPLLWLRWVPCSGGCSNAVHRFWSKGQQRTWCGCCCVAFHRFLSTSHIPLTCWNKWLKLHLPPSGFCKQELQTSAVIPLPTNVFLCSCCLMHSTLASLALLNLQKPSSFSSLQQVQGGQCSAFGGREIRNQGVPK